MAKPLMILIAGPYRSGTGDDPELMARNLARLEEAAWPIFRSGHVPMIGEWVALPVLRGAGGDGPTDPVAEGIMYPTAERLLRHCDAVLRLPGESTGADQDVRIARERGLPVYHRVEEIPGYRAGSAGESDGAGPGR
ncbi:DUF4406 domain-containing protein [Saccharothrix sp. NPDC042600]|uniref:DUF4406 domain-containing protein n=1 Tax=Saccharothrix TaxID=2071 RepID=UPI0033E7546A|nr:hypothetical protein GCM10017745_39180 [Saccharothrix mutabilis subsp. capreolus]